MTNSNHPTPTHTGTGFGRVIVATYGVFAISAFARAAYQLITDFHTAPMAYSLSGLAAAIYIVATIALARAGALARRIAAWAICIELIGVLAVGGWSVIAPNFFPSATVWSRFGSGYGYIPLILPLIGLWWLWRHRGHTT